MARILRGNRSGEIVKVIHFRPGGFLCETDDGPEMLSVTSLRLSIPEMEDILEQNKNGLLLRLYKPTDNLSFRKIKVT